MNFQVCIKMGLGGASCEKSENISNYVLFYKILHKPMNHEVRDNM